MVIESGEYDPASLMIYLDMQQSFSVANVKAIQIDFEQNPDTSLQEWHSMLSADVGCHYKCYRRSVVW